MINKIASCRLCGAPDPQPFFNLGDQPFANALTENPVTEDPRYPLSLAWCPSCNLVQLEHTADPGELFSRYVWVTSTSSTARSYAERFCTEVERRVAKDICSISVLELASNDGTFLKPFLGRKCSVLGVDPAENIVEIARRDGIPTECAFFGTVAAGEIIEKNGRFDVVIARNVIPHVANLHDFITGAKKAMKDDGLFVGEFHYAGTIAEELHYDSIYHEHLCYFTLKTFSHLLNDHGLTIVDIMESPISGGSFVVFARNGKSAAEQSVEHALTREDQKALNTERSWQTFASTSRDHRNMLLGILNDIQSKTMIGYGASARSSTMLNFCGIGTGYLMGIADQNPIKQGLFTPGTHIPILSPEKAMGISPDAILLLAWNFADEISGIVRNDFGFKGELIIPFPHPPKRTRI